MQQLQEAGSVPVIVVVLTEPGAGQPALLHLLQLENKQTSRLFNTGKYLSC